ncbi:flagellar hook-basal body complex protein FliE [Bacillaceae bacterium]
MELSPIRAASLEPQGKTKRPTAAQAAESFAQVLRTYLDNVNRQQLTAEKLAEKLATGEVANVHDVMIAAQKASLSLQLTVEIRNRAVEAYQEIMRMQI